ncbi:hypothetical protein PCANC_14607 [Puccinia coronata f. sp. avenae]|uniref:Uncharacterized protein n=1 Tax=Puccinia coronata f. sp. avenae TaxID=200324 RepID=A0A2N5UGA1_9BASI|nr:hypothetical protein PCANC_14607 [Puccinia coronata f. sp. avenae]
MPLQQYNQQQQTGPNFSQAMEDDDEVWVQIEEAISSFFLRSLQRIQPVWDILLIPATYADFNPATIDIRVKRFRMRINNDSWVDGLANFGKGLSPSAWG